MDAAMRAYLDDLHVEGRAHDAARADRLERRRNIEPESAAFLSALVRHRRARRVLEIGTSNGYSTLWLAEALRRTGGELTSVELDPGHSAEAESHLAAVGLSAHVTLVVEDAGEYLRRADGSVDLILLDAERPEYPAYLSDLHRLLDPAGGALVVDNVLSHADQVADFTRLVEGTEDLLSQTLPIGAGLLLAVRT